MKPVTGVLNGNSVGYFWDEDFIDLGYEQAFDQLQKEKAKELKISMEEAANLLYETDIDGGTQLYGSWKQNNKGEYIPDTNGEYSAIYDPNDNYIQVVHSIWGIYCNVCSPCFPGQRDVDSKGNILAYCLPASLMADKWIEENGERVFLI